MTDSRIAIAASCESFDPMDVMIRLYRESRRRAADLSAAPGAAADNLRARADAARGNWVALPPPLEQSQALSRSLHDRTAIRFYDPAPVGAAQLGTILRAASAGDRQDWGGEDEAGVGLQFLVVAWRVAGVEPAVYRYQPHDHTLDRLGPAPDQQEATSLALQTEFAGAPVIVFMTGNLAAACTRHGGWGHRQLLLRAGAAGQRLWLASLGVGLVGTVFAGFLPRAAHRFTGVDGNLEASLLAYSTGHFPRLGKEAD